MITWRCKFNPSHQLPGLFSIRVMSKKILIVLFCVALTLTTPAANSSRPLPNAPTKLSVLFIGNSYTYFNNLPELVSQLAASANPAKTLDAQMVTRGGATLKQHWEEGNALKVLRQGKWDYVVLQEQSMLPITDPEAMHKYARLFDAEIKKSGAKTVFFLTWARQNQPENQARLNDAYLQVTRELKALVAPVGITWANAFKADANFVFHIEDKSHPNPEGSYLAACVFYAVLYGKSPENLANRLLGNPVSQDGVVGNEKAELVNLNKTEAARLQRLAWQTVINERAVKLPAAN
jgi:hypothetical protein